MIRTIGIYLCGMLTMLIAGFAQAAPLFQAAGTAVSGAGAVTVAWPAHAIGDVALLFVESTGGQPVTLSTPSGFVAVANSPQATGTTTNGTQITVFWARATSTTMASAVVADPGDHVYARIITYRGVETTGNPWDVTGGGVKAAASTSVTVTGVTTTVADTLIVQAVARDNDSAAAAFSAETNANLAGIAERSDAGTTSGNGGGIAVWDGTFAAAGATGNTTATVTSSINAFLTIALKSPAGTTSVTSSPSTCSSVTGVGTVAWTNPLNATASDNIYATAMLATTTSNYLNCTGFNFSAVPAGVTITGITVYIERKADLANRVSDAFVYLIKGGVISTLFNGKTATAYTAADVTEAHGGPSNLWGTAWTVTDVQAANFGVAFAAVSTRTRTASVDHIKVRVDYAVPAVHHIRIEHDGSASTCAPESITLKACFNAACTPPYYTATDVTGINLSPTSAGYTWSPVNPQSIAAANGGISAGITLANTGAGTASLAITGTPSPVPGNAFECYNTTTLTSGGAGSAACNLVFASNTLAFSVPDHVSATRQVVTMTSCTAGFANTSRTVKFWSTYANPATGTLQGKVVAGAGNADCTTGYAALGTSSASSTSLSLAFGAGATPQATFSLCYPDAGEVRVDVRYDGSNANTPKDNGVVILGNDNFIAAPASFSFSGIACTTVSATACAPANLTGNNPAAANAAGSAFIQAGQPFKATVTALNAASPPAVTPNFGRGTPPETVTLQAVSNAALCPATSSCLIAPVGGASGTLSATFASAGAGTGAVATTDATWNEVGIIQLRAINTTYMGSILDIYGLSGNVGRFIPDHFDVTPDAITHVANRTDWCDASGLLVADGVTPCAWPAFTYMGERMDAQFLLAAQALNNTTTQNYTGSFAKLNPIASGTALAFGAVDAAAPTYLTARLDTSLITSSGSGSFNLGVADITAPIGITRGAAADGPYAALNIGVAPVDGDGVTTIYDLDTDATAGVDHTLIGSTEVRYGRINFPNAYGSELLPLSIPATVQYWNGTGFVTSDTDNATTLLNTDIVFSNWQNNLTAGATSVSPASVVFVNGAGNFILSAPGSGKDGSVDFNCIVPGYLPSNTARATFGVYGGKDIFIYRGRRGR